MSPQTRALVSHAASQTQAGWEWFWRRLCWTFGMLDEGHNPSLIRAGAVLLFVVGSHGRLADEKPLITNDVVVLSLACFATLGLKGMQLFKDWRGVKLESHQEDVRADITRREIQERREHGKEWGAESS